MEQINELCHRHKVRRLYAFGSAVDGRLGEDSDIDLLVDFSGVGLPAYAENYLGLKSSLEELFGRSVDLLEDKAIDNPYLRESIDSSKQLIYG